jgi:ELWxxDGT repeat protein
LFFATDPKNGLALWKTDGTAVGTSLVTVLRPAAGDFRLLRRMALVGDTLYFMVAMPGSTGWELWKSDGKSEGTSVVKLFPVQSEIRIAAGVSGKLLFSTSAPDVPALWSSDGTEDGTFMVKTIDAISTTSFATLDGELIFSGNSSEGTGLWVSDGTPEGTSPVPNVTLTGLTNFHTAGDTVFFTADDGIHGSELWAYEPLLGDLNRDRTVDRLDLSQLTQNLGRHLTVTSPLGDLNGDGRVTVADLAIFRNAWQTALQQQVIAPSPAPDQASPAVASKISLRASVRRPTANQGAAAVDRAIEDISIFIPIAGRRHKVRAGGDQLLRTQLSI